jgi:hypothetical protein
MILDKAFNPLEPSTLNINCEDFRITNIKTTTKINAIQIENTSEVLGYKFR